MPTVFISYAHESDAFRDDVTQLVSWLAERGCTVLSDHPFRFRPPPDGWQVWMKTSIRVADSVLVVCTPRLKARYDKTESPDSGLGATYEGAIVTQHIYNAAQRNDKFFPVLPVGGTTDDIPIDLQPWWNNHRFPSGNAAILRMLTDVHGAAQAPAEPDASTSEIPFSGAAHLEVSADATLSIEFDFSELPERMRTLLRNQSRTYPFAGPWFAALADQLRSAFPGCDLSSAESAVDWFLSAPQVEIGRVFRAIRKANEQHQPNDEPARTWSRQLTLLTAVRCISPECWKGFQRIQDSHVSPDALVGKAGTKHYVIACIGVAGLLGKTILLKADGILELHKIGPFVDLRAHLLGQVYDQISKPPDQRRSDPYIPYEDQVDRIRQYFRDLRYDGNFGAIVLRMPPVDGIDTRKICEELAVVIDGTVIEGLQAHDAIMHPDATLKPGDLALELDRLLGLQTESESSPVPQTRPAVQPKPAPDGSTNHEITSHASEDQEPIVTGLAGGESQPGPQSSGAVAFKVTSNALYDVFISYASEDRVSFVMDLVQQLESRALKVWWDQGQLTAGDRLMKTIDEGLSQSRFGVVILSAAFMGKQWPTTELDALFSREMLEGRKCVIPVCLDVGQDELVARFPLLAGKLHINASDGAEQVAQAIEKAVLADR